MTHALDVEADPQVLAGLMAAPAVSGLDEHRRGVPGLTVDRFDPAAQLARGPQGIDQLQIVVRKQG